MKPKISRRQLLGTSIAAGALNLSGYVPSASAAAANYRWRPPSDRKRRALIASARFGRKTAVNGSRGLAICSHPLASQAAVDMLKAGGTAADAICAAGLTQTVVEPHMTTLSGCFSMLYYEADSGEYSYVNGMMAAPASHPFLTEPDFSKLMVMQNDGGLCMVPGFWGGVEEALSRHGRLPLKTVVAPSIHYAREGFEIHPFLWGEMFVENAVLGAVPETREIYFSDNTLLNIGDKLIQSRAADTLERLADEGSDYFYRGEFARKYAETVQATNGYVTFDDMLAYKPFWDDPVRGTYRDYDLIGSPAPDFGGQALVEIMNMVELMDLQRMGPAFESPETTLKQLQIVGQVYADAITGRFLGDLPSVEKAVSKNYAEERFAKLKGKPIGTYDNSDFLDKVKITKPGSIAIPPGSNHITVVDAEGNVATVLHSVMSYPYQTGIYSEGVYVAATGVHLGSGTVEPGGHLHARICPNIFAKNGKPVLASGSPSVSLTENIVQNSVNILDFGIDIETSVHKPRFGGSSPTNFSYLLMEADMGQATIDYMRDAGANVDIANPWNWHHGSFEGIHINDQGVAKACPDPRRTAQAIAV